MDGTQRSEEGHAMSCPQCGEPTEDFSDGVCVSCSEDNQACLLLHNIREAAWRHMSPAQRDEAIRRATR